MRTLIIIYELGRIPLSVTWNTGQEHLYSFVRKIFFLQAVVSQNKNKNEINLNMPNSPFPNSSSRASHSTSQAAN